MFKYDGKKLHFVQTNDGWHGLYADGELVNTDSTSSIYTWLSELGIEFTSSEEEDHPEAQCIDEMGYYYGFDWDKVKFDF
jgi:hypothetical protein